WTNRVSRRAGPPRWDEADIRQSLYLAGITTGLKAGDPLLVSIDEARPGPFRIVALAVETEAGRTRVLLQPWDLTQLPMQLRDRLMRLQGRATAGVTADRIVEILEDVAPVGAGRRELAARLSEAMTGVRTLMTTLTVSAPNLRAWADEVLVELGRELEVLTLAEPTECPFEDLARKLSRPPSTPPANASQLPRSLTEDFDSTGDAALRMLAGTSPDLADRLEAGLPGCRRASPRLPVRVWALRLRAGLYGRTFPRKM